MCIFHQGLLNAQRGFAENLRRNSGVGKIHGFSVMFAYQLQEKLFQIVFRNNERCF